MKKISMGNPTDTQRFKTMCAIAARQGKYQRLLWKRLREAMAEGRRNGQDSQWRASYIALLERVVRHEIRMEKNKLAGQDWIYSRSMKPRRPSLRVIQGTGQ
jgi:hypothetical protein